jgi:hypothetical protein
MKKFFLLLTLLFVGILANAQFTPSNNLNYVKLLKVPPAGAVEDSVVVYDGSDSFVKMRPASSMPISTATQTALDLKGKYDWFTINATKRQDYVLQREYNSTRAYTQLTAREVSLQQVGDTWCHAAIVNLHQSSTKLYVVSTANQVTTGDNALDVNCFVRLQILQGTTGGTINTPILSTTTLAKNGDVIGGKTIISGAGIPNAYMVGDVLHITFTAQCSDGIWYLMHNTVNCLTDVIGTPEICTMESGLMNTQKIATHLGRTDNDQISMNGTFTAFGGYYYAGVACYDFWKTGAIIRTTNFVDWEFVKEPIFTGINPQCQWEISMGTLGSNMYMAMRQIDLNPSSDVKPMILAKLDSSCNVLDWVEVPSLVSRPEFFSRNASELFLAFPTNSRLNTVLLLIDPVLRNSRPVQDMAGWGNYVSIAQKTGNSLQFAVKTYGAGSQGIRISSMYAGSMPSTTASTIRDYVATLTSDAQAQLTARPTGTGTNGYLSFWNSSSSITGDSGAFWDNSNKRLGLGTTAPTHPLTLGSTFAGSGSGQGISLYRTADQVTNYERFVMKYNTTNQYLIGSEQGGTGAARPILINTNGRSLTINDNTSSQFAIIATNPMTGSTNAGIFRTSGGWSGASGINTTLQLATTYTHTGTASGRELFISPYYQTLGSGTYSLIDVGTNTAADATGTHTSLFKVNNVGLVNMVNANLSSATASTIAIFDASKNIISAPTATYPSLTEFGYGKGVTSPIQTQIDSKANNLLTGYISGAGTISGSDSVKSAIEKLNGNQQLAKKSFVYNFDGIELSDVGGTYFMKPLTGLIYSNNKSTSDYTVLKTLSWYRCAFITPYKCRLKKASFGTNGGVALYIGGIDATTTTKSDIYNAYSPSAYVYNDTNVVVEANTRIYLAFKTSSTGAGIMEGTLYFEEF